MSFRRYVGKIVRVTIRGASGTPVEYIGKLFEYEESGIWVHHRNTVQLPDGSQTELDGLLFLPHTQILHVFASEELDKLAAPMISSKKGS